MSQAHSTEAIGAVSRWLKNRLTAWGGINVTIGRPEAAAGSGNNPKFNLFLYETHLDASLRNVSLDEGQLPPLWLVVKYLLTAFDVSGDSDTLEAHELLGRGMSALQELAYLSINSAPTNIQQALHKNPEPLKITFDEINAELLSKVMQGSDEKYRLSIGFQVRPVLILPPEPPSYALLVGINYQTAPPTVIGEAGRVLNILPSLGISVDEVTPAQFEANSTLSLTGTDLNLSGVEVFLGPAALTIVPPAVPGELKCSVNGPIAAGAVMSAGSYPVFARQALPGGKFRSSNLLVGNLLPTLAAATPSGLANVTGGRVRGNLRIKGQLLGTASDDVLVAFYRDGGVERLFDAGDPAVASSSFMTMNAGQTQIDLTVGAAQAMPSGTYRVILRVNGQQARVSPEVNWT